MNTPVTKKTRKKKSKKAVASTPVMVPVIRVLNPFDPRQHVREEMVWGSNKTLDDYFPLRPTDIVVSVNGRIVPKEEFSVTYLDKGDNLVICPVPAGGDDDSKTILSIIAMIAIYYFAPYLANAAGTAFGLSATTVGVIQAGIVIAGSMLVSSVFAPSRPTRSSSHEESSSYGVDGAKNTSLEGIPVPVCYGRYRMAGNIIGMYTVNDGDTQFLYMLINAGEGPVASLTNIEINDNPVSDYNDVEVQVRLGAPVQEPIPWFADTITPVSINAKITTDYVTYTTAGTVDKFRIDVVCPTGIAKIDKKSGEANFHTVPLEIEYRQHGSSDWKSIPLLTNMSRREAVRGIAGAGIEMLDGLFYRVVDGVLEQISTDDGISWEYEDGTAVTDPEQLRYLRANGGAFEVSGSDSFLFGKVPIYTGGISVGGAKRSTLRKSFESGQLDHAKYDIRIKRTTLKSEDASILDEVYVSDINEIVLEDVTYANTALVGLKIRLTDQLSGIPKVTYLHGGKLIRTYGKPTTATVADQWYSGPSDNPAWIVWDMLTNKRYGAALATSRLDFNAFKNWAAYCVEKNLTFHGVIDSEMTVWDATQLVLRTGHAQLINIGTRYTAVVEKATEPVMLFSVANMIEGSYKETWLGTADRANEIDVTFFDKNDKYKSRTIKVYDTNAFASGQKQKNAAITLYGVDDYDRAYAEGQFQLNLNRKILKTVEFSAPMEAIGCTVGDVILVQNDMTDWAVAGRCNAGSTTSVVNLDRDITMEPEKQYKLLTTFDSIKRAEGVILSKTSTSVIVSGYNGSTVVKRLKIGALDVPVFETFNTGSGWGVVLENTTGISVGDSYSLWDTDVIEERSVVNNPGTFSSVTLQSPLTEAPPQFGHWMFGETDKVKKPFRIKSITGSHDYKREITAIEYNEEVYDFDNYGPGKNTDIPVSTAISHVTSLEAYEESYISGQEVLSKAVVSWRPPTAGLYAGADIYVSKNGGNFDLVQSVNYRTFAEVAAAKGDTIKFKIVAFNAISKRAGYDSAPEISLKMTGEVPDLDVGDVTGADLYWQGRDCKIVWRYNSTTHSFEFGSEPTGADAGSLDPHFKDYEIRVYDKMHATLRRTEYTTDNSYVYSYDKNFADGLTRRLVFEIRMRDKFNNVGKPTVLEAYNPPPQVTSIAVVPTFESATIKYEHTQDPDFAGAQIYLSQNQSLLDPLTPGTLVYQGPDTAVVLPGLMFKADYYYRILPYDVFGTEECLPTPVNQFKTTNLNVDAIAEGVLSGSKLIPALQERINLVDGPATLANSVAARLLQEAQARQAAITTEAQTRQSADQSLSTSITTLTAALNDNAAAVSNEATARATQDTALAQQISVVATKTNDNQAAILNEQTARTNADSSLATQVSAVSAVAANKSKVFRQSTQPTATAVNDVWIDTGNNNATKTWNGTAWIDASDARIAQNAAAITNEATARANADSALSTSINTVSTTVNGHTTAIQAQTTSIDGLNGQYTLKIDTNGYVSGFGLAQYPRNDGSHTSEFVIRADTFAMVMPSYPKAYPFTIGAVNGTPRVIISKALIGDASIENAMIGNAQVNTLKIGANAVTVPDVVTASSIITGSGINAWHVAFDRTISLDQAGWVYAHAIMQQSFGSGTKQYAGYLEINGVNVFGWGGAWADGVLPLAGALYCSAGPVRVRAFWWGEDSGVRVTSRTLFIQGAKR